MCQLREDAFKQNNFIRCGEGLLLEDKVYQAYHAYVTSDADQETQQKLYNAYDQAKAALGRHQAESQGMKSF